MQECKECKEEHIGAQKPTAKSKAFMKPLPEEVQEYARLIGFILDGEHFCDYYEARGWMVGKVKMKSWQAAVRTWKRNGYEAKKKPDPGPPAPSLESWASDPDDPLFKDLGWNTDE